MRSAKEIGSLLVLLAHTGRTGRGTQMVVVRHTKKSRSRRPDLSPLRDSQRRTYDVGQGRLSAVIGKGLLHE